MNCAACRVRYAFCCFCLRRDPTICLTKFFNLINLQLSAVVRLYVLPFWLIQLTLLYSLCCLCCLCFPPFCTSWDDAVVLISNFVFISIVKRRVAHTIILLFRAHTLTLLLLPSHLSIRPFRFLHVHLFSKIKSLHFVCFFSTG